jgi:DNA modification methylase
MWNIITADVMDGLRTLESGSVQTVCTSPPYWGLRDYGIDAQLGLEIRPDCLGWATGAECGECYVCHLVAVFREVKRVLKDDGTLWLNLGDSYATHNSGGKGYSHNFQTAEISESAGFSQDKPSASSIGLKEKDLIMIPARVALALQADGWWLRSDIIWAKSNGMPESVTDRPTKAHEHIFLLAKSQSYYYDNHAERTVSNSNGGGWSHTYAEQQLSHGAMHNERPPSENGANLRDVWQFPTGQFGGAHFAVFPEELPRRCVKLGTSERGECPQCGKAWVRVADTHRHLETGRKTLGIGNTFNPMRLGEKANGYSTRLHHDISTITVGWRPQCDCNAGDPIPQLVADIFCGAGTTGLVAVKLGRRFVGIELNPEYVKIASDRIAAEHGLTIEQAATNGDQNAQLRLMD